MYHSYHLRGREGNHYNKAFKFRTKAIDEILFCY